MLGDNIKNLREEANLTQADLAKLLNVSPSTVGMWEQNRRSPDTEFLKKLTTIFNVSSDYLLGISMFKNYTDDPNITIALHTDTPYSELTDEARKEVNDFIEYVKQKYKSKK